MKIRFELKNISGKEIFDCFANNIKEEGIGFDPDFNSSASLEEGGTKWRTAWSGFSYKIENPGSDDAAVVVYDGAWRGFLAQNLIPSELSGETRWAEVTEGSALKAHGMDKFLHTEARVLAEAYGLMQKTCRDFCGRKVLGACIRAVEGAQEVSHHLKKMGAKDSWAVADNTSTAFAPGNIEKGDPVIRVFCCPGGRQVDVEFRVDPTPPDGYVLPHEHSLTEAADQAKAWLDRIRPVLDLHHEVEVIPRKNREE